MKRFFEYREVRVAPLGWAAAAATISTRSAAEIETAGGRLYGVWPGQIGLARDEGIIMTAWPDAHSARAHGGLAAAHDVLETRAVHYLEATVRPTSDEPPPRQGFYAHRFFELSSTDWPEFLSLSDEAWPSMEAAVQARIHGFWRSLDERGERTRVLLLTQYMDLMAWERSRWWGRPEPGAEDAMRRFRRRAELVDWTRVTICSCP
ncbi:MAG: hypothetical protein KDK91_15815 [Gammaproteobacteria bacterium]|nr:hypothetical protein [Gammaproteobacteria bacterium]